MDQHLGSLGRQGTEAAAVGHQGTKVLIPTSLKVDQEEVLHSHLATLQGTMEARQAVDRMARIPVLNPGEVRRTKGYTHRALP